MYRTFHKATNTEVLRTPFTSITMETKLSPETRTDPAQFIAEPDYVLRHNFFLHITRYSEDAKVRNVRFSKKKKKEKTKKSNGEHEPFFSFLRSHCSTRNDLYSSQCVPGI